MKITLEQLIKNLQEEFIEYYNSAIPVANISLRKEREEILKEQKTLQEPWLELMKTYKSADRSLGESLSEGNLPLKSLKLFQLMFNSELKSLYKHQEQALLLSRDGGGKHFIVSTGTGSGKTESFLLPILADLVEESLSWPQANKKEGRWWESETAAWKSSRSHENREEGMRALVLYPMNALVEDQLSRMRRLLDSKESLKWMDQNIKGNKFYFGRYTSLTPGAGPVKNITTAQKAKSAVTVMKNLAQTYEAALEGNPENLVYTPSPDGAEMQLRWDMQTSPPDIMITNHSMLNVMLMREQEKEIFEKTKKRIENGGIFTLVIDELHMHRGTAGTEVAYLLRKLIDRLGLRERPEQLRIIATTASFDPVRDSKFLSDFFGQDSNKFHSLPGETVEPSGTINLDLLEKDYVTKKEAADALKASGVASALSKIFVTKGKSALSLGEIANALYPTEAKFEQHKKLQNILTLMLKAEAETPLKIRAHLFFRPPTGVWACSNDNCLYRGNPSSSYGVGKLYAEPKYRCECGSGVLELISCQGCGEHFLGGYHTDTQEVGKRDESWHVVPAVTNLEMLPEHAISEKTSKNYTLYWPDATRKPTGSLSSGKDGTKQRSTKNEENEKTGTYVLKFEPAHWDAGKAFMSICGRNDDPSGWVYKTKISGSASMDNAPAFPTSCPRCGEDWESYKTKRAFEDPERQKSPLRQMNPGYNRPLHLLTDVMMRALENDKKKLVVFSDSRQAAAKVSAGTERAHYQNLFRAITFKQLNERHPIVILNQCLERKDYATIQKVLHSLEHDNSKVKDLFNSKITASYMGVEDKKINEEWNSLLKKYENKRQFSELADNVISQILKLGLNPAGTAGKYNYSEKDPEAPASKAKLWTELVNWEDENRGLSENLTNPYLHRLASKIREGTLKQLVISLFGGSNNDVEGMRLARLEYAVEPEDKVELAALRGTIRLLALRKFIDGMWIGRADEKEPGFVKKYLTDLAGVHGRSYLELLNKVDKAIDGTKNSWVLKSENLILALPEETDSYSCEQCRSRYLQDFGGVCPTLGCGQKIVPAPFEQHYYAKGASNQDKIYRLHCEELTGQTSRTEAFKRQTRFRNIMLSEDIPEVHEIDLLSVTTTMEAGVDIGGLQAVILGNVPPMRFNYQQRVGRAGRRDEPLSLALTLCRGTRSHDQYHFENPEHMVSSPAPRPYLDLTRFEIVQRSVVAEILRRAFDFSKQESDEKELGTNVHGQFGKVYTWEGKWKNKITDWLESETGKMNVSSIINLHLNEGNSDIPLLEEMKKQLIEYSSSKEGTGLIQNITEAAALDFGSDDLSQRLAENGILPMFGFPTQVRHLWHRDPKGKTYYGAEWPPEGTVDRPMNLAVSAFAPGASIVKDKHIHPVVGVVSYEKKGNFVSEGAGDALGPSTRIATCSVCQDLNINPDESTECLTCGANEEEGYLKITAHEPLGFRTDYRGRPYEENMETSSAGSYPRLSPPKGSWRHDRREDNVWLRAGHVDSFVVNDNHGAGFRFARSEGEDGLWSLDAQEKANPLTNFPKKYEEAQKPVALWARQQTDALILIPNSLPSSLRVSPKNTSQRAALASLAFLIRKAGAALLDVETTEMNAGLYLERNRENKYGVFISDVLDNGAGYSTELGVSHRYNDFKKQIKDICQSLSEKDHATVCDSSCYKCLRDHKNTGYHPLLDWRSATDLAARMFDFDNTAKAELLQSAQNFCNNFPEWEVAEESEDGDAIQINWNNGKDLAFILIPSHHSLERNSLNSSALKLVQNLEESGYRNYENTNSKKGKTYSIESAFDLLRRPGKITTKLQKEQ